MFIGVHDLRQPFVTSGQCDDYVCSPGTRRINITQDSARKRIRIKADKECNPEKNAQCKIAQRMHVPLQRFALPSQINELYDILKKEESLYNRGKFQVSSFMFRESKSPKIKVLQKQIWFQACFLNPLDEEK